MTELAVALNELKFSCLAIYTVHVINNLFSKADQCLG